MASPSSAEHKREAARQGAVAVAVVTVSDTRTQENDVNGRYLESALASAENKLHSRRIVKDEPAEVEEALEALAADPAVQVIVFNGGTGLSRRDRTFDVLSRKLERQISGFGEIFRVLSYEQVGSAAMLSRATAGVYRGKVVFSTPGSPAAVQLAWEKLIAPELRHLVWELAR